jgi:chemotaxis protein MotA
LPADPFAAANRRIAMVVLRSTAKPAEPPTPVCRTVCRTTRRAIEHPTSERATGQPIGHPIIRLTSRPGARAAACHVAAVTALSMLTIGGLVFLLVRVFGSYLVSGESVAPLAEAVPFELWTIGGAAMGSIVMANSMHDVMQTLGGFGKILKGASFGKADYVDLLSPLYYLIRLASTKGNMALEPHIENPEVSPAFQKYPKILANHHASSIICDYLRMVGINADDPNQIEDVMGRELRKTLGEEVHGAHAPQTMADGLPALGIVAAVLGVIKTMSHIDQPPAALGAMIGSALTGTLLGVLLAYGMVGPFASRLKGVVEGEAKYFEVIRAVLVTHLHGNAPQVSVESGRKMVPNEHMPSFQELEEAVQAEQM